MLINLNGQRIEAEPRKAFHWRTGKWHRIARINGTDWALQRGLDGFNWGFSLIGPGTIQGFTRNTGTSEKTWFALDFAEMQ